MHTFLHVNLLPKAKTVFFIKLFLICLGQIYYLNSNELLVNPRSTTSLNCFQLLNGLECFTTIGTKGRKYEQNLTKNLLKLFGFNLGIESVQRFK